MIELDKYIAETIRQISLGIQTASEECKDLGVIVNPNITVGSSSDFYVPSDLKHLNVQRRVQNLEMEISLSIVDSNESKGGVNFGISVWGAGANISNSGKKAGENKVKFSIPVCFPTTRINK